MPQHRPVFPPDKDGARSHLGVVPTPMTAVLVAIDIAKSRNEVLIEIPASWRRRLIKANTRVEHDSFRDKFDRYVAMDRHHQDLRREAFTAMTAKMGRVVHAIIKRGDDYRAFVEGWFQAGNSMP